ncbi:MULTISPECIES: ABC transporter permease [Anaerolinea]|uniref:ABC transporter permease n=1 Tax=Anaerolinea TaxID=233189 RepID=UPI002604E329|nr:ABC transporter permease [Anaerolinea thermophila]
MIFGEVLKIAWDSLMANKLRSFLTMLGVIIGVAAVIVMVAISAGTEAAISEAINGLGSNLVFISSAFSRGGPTGGPQTMRGGLVYEDMTAIRERISGVAGVTVEQQTSVTVKYENTSLEDVMMVGATPDFPTVRDVRVEQGRFYNDTELERASKVVVLGKTVAGELFGETDPIGQTVSVNSIKLTVIGVMAEKGLVAGVDFDQQIYVPITLVFKKFMPAQFARIMGDRVRQIIVSVDPDADMDKVIEQITLLLANRHGVTLDSLDFTIRTQADIIATQESTTESFRTLLAWVAGVSLIVGGIGIMNIMLVSVTERTREIGLRQAVGAAPADIQVQFLMEALLLSLVGGLLGILAGIGGAYLFERLGGMRTVVLPYSIGFSFLSAALVGVFFGFLPAKQAADLDPIVALRHE